ncbi:hypothetical protein CSOJ01_12779 [Colletotrichum sojae]|uniref:Uncharacterized protein n=1 Tax=Colletotrichum sojae TaxID=2175907 RepID=A0A8H6MLY8_9PEZI|nr:hypothetical protein CSOJ01_12779 [Colletotrichum sojae]
MRFSFLMRVSPSRSGKDITQADLGEYGRFVIGGRPGQDLHSRTRDACRRSITTWATNRIKAEPSPDPLFAGNFPATAGVYARESPGPRLRDAHARDLTRPDATSEFDLPLAKNSKPARPTTQASFTHQPAQTGLMTEAGEEG